MSEFISAAELEALRAEVGAKQARIDALMLEFCPDEMTPEQMAEWATHQVARPELARPDAASARAALASTEGAAK